VHIMSTIIQVLKNLTINQLCINTMEEWVQLHQGISKSVASLVYNIMI